MSIDDDAYANLGPAMKAQLQKMAAEKKRLAAKKIIA